MLPLPCDSLIACFARKSSGRAILRVASRALTTAIDTEVQIDERHPSCFLLGTASVANKQRTLSLQEANIKKAL